MEHYIITGASGHLGNSLAQELIARGKRVIITLRTYKYMSPLYCADAEVAYGDLTDEKFLIDLIDEDSVVIHCAGLMELGKGNKKNLFKVNFEGTKKLVDVCIKEKAKKFIYVSTVDAIEKKDDGKDIREPLGEIFPDNLPSAYAQSKAAATKYVLEQARAGKINANVVYPTSLIGPNDHKVSNNAQIMVDYINKEKLALVKGSYNFVDVRDVIDGIIKIIKVADSGEDFILGGYDVSVKSFFELINKKIKRTTLPKELSRGKALLFAWFMNIGKKVEEKKVVYNSYFIKSLDNNHKFSSKKAKERLAFKTRPVEQTFADAIDWLQENKPELFR